MAENDGVVGELVTWRGDDNACIGCAEDNPRGFGLHFWQVAEQTVECRLTPDEHMCGAPGIVHGGVQSVILDECMGYACHTASQTWDVATVDLSLRFRRPVRAGEPIVATATIDEIDGTWISLSAQIRDTDGEVLTRATGRWKILGELADDPRGAQPSS